MNTIIQSLINETIEKTSQYKTGLRDTAKFSVSDAGACYRMRFLKRLGVEPERTIEIEALRKMMAGTAGHEMIQSLLTQGKKLFLSENELETEHIMGHPDGVVKSDNIKYLLEIKTIEKWQMGYIKKLGAKRPHELQMFTYWTMLRDDIKDLNRAVLCYIKREDFEAQEYYYNWTDQIASVVKEEWKPLIKYWTDKVLPPCTCSEMYDGAGIGYCRYMTEWDKTSKIGKCCDEKLFKP